MNGTWLKIPFQKTRDSGKGEGEKADLDQSETLSKPPGFEGWNRSNLHESFDSQSGGEKAQSSRSKGKISLLKKTIPSDTDSFLEHLERIIEFGGSLGCDMGGSTENIKAILSGLGALHVDK